MSSNASIFDLNERMASQTNLRNQQAALQGTGSDSHSSLPLVKPNEAELGDNIEVGNYVVNESYMDNLQY